MTSNLFAGRLGLAESQIRYCDRHGLIWLSRGNLSVIDGTLRFKAAEGPDLNAGDYAIPYQSVSMILLGPGSTVSHDCAIGDFVTVAPGVNVAGNVTIGDGCLIGVGAKIVNDIRIGKGSCVGAGAVVTKDVPEGMFAAGVPAKPTRKVRESDLKGLS